MIRVFRFQLFLWGSLIVLIIGLGNSAWAQKDIFSFPKRVEISFFDDRAFLACKALAAEFRLYNPVDKTPLFLPQLRWGRVEAVLDRAEDGSAICAAHLLCTVQFWLGEEEMLGEDLFESDLVVSVERDREVLSLYFSTVEEKEDVLFPFLETHSIRIDIKTKTQLRGAAPSRLSVPSWHEISVISYDDDRPLEAIHTRLHEESIFFEN